MIDYNTSQRYEQKIKEAFFVGLKSVLLINVEYFF